MSDMDQMKADCSSELQRVLSELENLRSEKQRLEGEIKKGKLISANYDENLKKLENSQNENSKKLEKLRKMTEKEEKLFGIQKLNIKSQFSVLRNLAISLI